MAEQTERIIEVPSSLIERALKYDVMPPASRAELRALLAQSTADALPEIEDMAVGTTFTAVITGGVQRSKYERVSATPEGSVWKVYEPATGHYWNPDAFERSSIRNVIAQKV